MAKGGAFNVSQLVRELGLTAVSPEDMRVLQTIQPTLQVGNLSDVTPPHVGPSALFGAVTVGAVGERGMFEMRCLAPGGAFVEWILFSTELTGGQFRITTTQALNPAGGPIVVPSAGQMSRDPVVSLAFQGSQLATGLPSVSIVTSSDQFRFGATPLFVPRGSFFSIESTINNTIAILGIGWREVPASEHVPA